MSRSFKKVANVNDGKKVDKQIHGRRLRHRNRIQISKENEPLLPYEVTNKYDIRDYNKTYFNPDEDKIKHIRK